MTALSINAFAQIPTTGLVGYYPFTGNSNDLSGNNLNGTVNGATLTTNRFGDANAAYSFDGINDYIEISNNTLLNLQDSLTISLWFAPNNPSASPSQRLIDKSTVNQGDGWYMAVGGNLSSLHVGGNSAPDLISHPNFNTSNWYHLVATYDRSFARFYINGVLDTSIAITGQTVINSHSVKIGANSLLSVNFFSGKMDDIRIYNKALTSTDVTALYNENNCSSADIATGLVGRYDFPGNANDLSVNNYNGTVYGATLTSDRFGNPNSAYNFNGTSDYISVNNAPLTNYPYTISAWIKLSAIDNTGKPIIGLGELGTNNLKKCYFDPIYGNAGKPSIGDAGACDITSTSNVVTTGVWTHMVVTVSSYSTSGVTFYVNNVAYTQNTTAGTNVPFPLNNAGFTIGSHKGGNSVFSYFSGLLDDIRIYNRVLTACDIESLYNMPNPLTTGISETEIFSSTFIYPNPSTDKITLNTTTAVDIRIYNYTGQVVKSILNNSGKVDVSDLNNGIYFFEVSSKNSSKKSIYKFVKN